MTLPIEFPRNPSTEDVRAELERRLSSLTCSLRVGSVEKSEGDTILAEVVDNHDTVVLHVEVDERTGQTLRMR